MAERSVKSKFIEKQIKLWKDSQYTKVDFMNNDQIVSILIEFMSLSGFFIEKNQQYMLFLTILTLQTYATLGEEF